MTGTGGLVEQWAPLISRLARTNVFARLGMDEEDVRSDLQEVLLREGQRQGGEMSPALAVTVLKRRITVLRRNDRAGYRRAFQVDAIAPGTGKLSALYDVEEFEWSSRVPDPADPCDQTLDEHEGDARVRAIVEALRARLGVGEYAVLHLRFVEGLTSREIARLSGQDTADVVKSVKSAKGRAREFLHALGVDTLEAP